MKHVRNSLIFFIIFISTTFILVFAHSGRLDSNGGHWNHATGEYHYHSGEHTEGTSSSSAKKYKYNYKKKNSTTKEENNSNEKKENKSDDKKYMYAALGIVFYVLPLLGLFLYEIINQ